MEDSILKTVKSHLAIEHDDDAFDVEIITGINTALEELHDLGVGPPAGFEVENADDTWTEFVGAVGNTSSVKTFVELKLRLLFNPPESGFGITSIEKLLTETTVRISMRREAYAWVDPTDPTSTLPVSS